MQCGIAYLNIRMSLFCNIRGDQLSSVSWPAHQVDTIARIYGRRPCICDTAHSHQVYVPDTDKRLKRTLDAMFQDGCHPVNRVTNYIGSVSNSTNAFSTKSDCMFQDSFIDVYGQWGKDQQA